MHRSLALVHAGGSFRGRHDYLRRIAERATYRGRNVAKHYRVAYGPQVLVDVADRRSGVPPNGTTPSGGAFAEIRISSSAAS
jgi:hypothetical protein